MAEPVAVALTTDSVRARYALATLLGLLGLQMREVPTEAEAEVSYGDSPGVARCAIPAGPQHDWDDPRPLLARAGGLPIIHHSDGPARGGIGFDLLYATYACLAGVWEAVDPSDEVGCPIAAEGWLARNGVLDEPLVHRYASLLADALGRGRLPEPTLVMTHDVDSNWGDVFAVRESWALFRRELRAGKPSAARRAAGLARRLARAGRADPNDCWHEWAQLEGRWSGRPAYFVASHGLFDPGSARYDPPYDIRHPTAAATLRRLAEEGAEIGVHFSIGARTSVERLRRERERLEEVLRAPVRSSRHHWWALGAPPEPTLRAHAEIGIRVDCSLGFNDRPGFRRGIAWPFRPFDREQGQPLEMWALPTTLMDIALWNGVTDRREALAELHAHVDTLRRHGGALVLNWHAHALNPRVLNGAREGAVALADALERRPLATATPLELAEAAERRSGTTG